MYEAWSCSGRGWLWRTAVCICSAVQCEGQEAPQSMPRTATRCVQHAMIIVRMYDRVCVQVCLRRDGREHAIIRAEASCQPQNFTQLVLDTLRRRFNITGEWLWVISTHIMRNAYTIIVVLNSSDYPLLQHSLLKIFSMSRFQILTLLRSVFNIK